MKDSLKISVFCACLLALAVLTARCAAQYSEESVHEAMLSTVRVAAPDESGDTYERVRSVRLSDEDAVSESEQTDTSADTEGAAETVAQTTAKTVSVSFFDITQTPLDSRVAWHIEQMCTDRDVDAAVVIAIIERESGFDTHAVGDDGAAFGLMQIRPDCHYDRMERLGVTDLFDAIGNVTVGIDYLDECLDRCGGDYAAALTMYNRGSFDGEVNAYAKAVLASVKEMESGGVLGCQ